MKAQKVIIAELERILKKTDLFVGINIVNIC